MGGARKFEYPKWVWTPSGGWWGYERQANWKRNGFIYLVFSAVACYAAVKYVEDKVQVYQTPQNVPFKVNGGHHHAHHGDDHGHGGH